MPLEILLLLVIGGIAGIAVILHLAGLSRRTVLSAEDARSAWHRQFPDDLILDVTPTPHGHAALVQTGDGPGLVWAFGADTAARPLRDFDLLDCPAGLRIVFHDFTAPAVTLRLSESERQRWRHMLETP